MADEKRHYRWAVVDVEADEILDDTIQKTEQGADRAGYIGYCPIMVSSMGSPDPMRQEWRRMKADGEYRVARFRLVESPERPEVTVEQSKVMTGGHYARAYCHVCGSTHQTHAATEKEATDYVTEALQRCGDRLTVSVVGPNGGVQDHFTTLDPTRPRRCFEALERKSPEALPDLLHNYQELLVALMNAPSASADVLNKAAQAWRHFHGE